MNIYYETFATPLGSFSVAVNGQGALVATAFGDLKKLKARLKQKSFDLVEDAAYTSKARRQVEDYFSGKRKDFDLVLSAEGTAFQHRIWKALLMIPRGETRSYGQLAAQTGNPKASRAVGRANATNPICLIVPCHRVIGADGSLTGFAFGEDIKRRLLQHEQSKPW